MGRRSPLPRPSSSWKCGACQGARRRGRQGEGAAKLLAPWAATWTADTKLLRHVDLALEVDVIVEEMKALELEIGTPPPASIKCPITGHVMKEPVAAADGKVYEKSVLLLRFSRGDMTSPVDPSVVLTRDLLPTAKVSRAILQRRGIC